MYWNGSVIAGSAVGNWTSDGTNAYRLTGNVGIGTDTPTSKLDVDGDINIASGSALKMGGEDFISERIDRGSDNIVIGKDSFNGSNTTSNGNIIIGIGSVLPSANQNVQNSIAIGHNIMAEDGIYMSSNSVAIGNNTMAQFSHFGEGPFSEYNVAIGVNSMAGYMPGNQTIGSTAIGYEALYVPQSSSTAVGYQALRNRSGSASFNTAVGYRAGRGSDVPNNSTGGSYFGYEAGLNVTTGAHGNSFFGRQAGRSVTTGANNTLLGYFAGDNVTTGDRNIIIGYNVDAVSATADDQLNIGNTIYGDLSSDQIGIGVDPEQALHVAGTIRQTAAQNCSLDADANGDIICTASDKNLKTNDGTLTNALAKIQEITPRYFIWNDSERFGSRRDVGFFAQDVQKVLPEAVTDTGDYLSLNYSRITALNLAAIKELNTKVDTLALAGTGFETSEGLFERIAEWFETRVFRAREVETERVETKEFCIEGVCITKEEFKELLESGNVEAVDNADEEEDSQQNTENGEEEEDVVEENESEEKTSLESADSQANSVSNGAGEQGEGGGEDPIRTDNPPEDTTSNGAGEESEEENASELSTHQSNDQSNE